MKRTIIIQAIAVLVLLVTLVIGQVAGKTRRDQGPETVSDIIGKDIDYVTLELSGVESEDISLTAIDGRWMVEGPGGVTRVARQERIEDLVETVFDNPIIRKASSNAQNPEEYGLGSDPLNILRIFDQQRSLITAVHFGNVASDTAEQFIGFENSSTVYTVPTSTGFYLEQSETYWTELRVWPEERRNASANSTGFSIEYSDGISQSWSKSDGEWSSPGSDDEGDEKTANPDSLVSTFLRMEAEGIAGTGADLPEDARLDFTARLQMADGTSYSVRMYRSGKEPETGYYLLPEGEGSILSPEGLPRLYTIPQWRYEALLGS